MNLSPHNPVLPPRSNMVDRSNDRASELEAAQIQWRNLFSRPTSPGEAPQLLSHVRYHKPGLLTRSNQRENHRWGDILGQKSSHYTRVNVQNVNGISIDGRGGQLNDICAVAQETQADIFVVRNTTLTSRKCMFAVSCMIPFNNIGIGLDSSQGRRQFHSQRPTNRVARSSLPVDALLVESFTKPKTVGDDG